MNESAFRSFDAPLPNADRFPASKNRFATQVSSQGSKREKRASNASFQGKPSAVKRTEAKPEKKKKKGFLSIPNIFKKKNTEK